jgi:hypothetical protein
MRYSITPRVCTLVTTAFVLFSAACSPDAPTGPEAAASGARASIAVAAGTYFVSPTGSDTNPGTEVRPWRTIRQSLTRLRPGQRLYVRGGRYAENIRNPTIQPGRADARITVAAYPGERPIIVGLLWLTRPSYWTFDGINVTWSTSNSSTSHMVKMTNGVGWSYENSELWGARSFAAMLVYGSVAGEPANWTLRGNCVHDTYASNSGNQDHNLYINTGTSAGAGLIERNILFNAPNGQNVKLGYGRSTPQPGDGTSNVTVRYNTMYGARKSLLVSDESHHNTIERNIIVRSQDGYAIRAYRLSGAGNVFRDNVFFGMTRFQYADPGYGSVADGGGNVLPLDPKFDGVGCAMFKPAEPAAQSHGRFAP